jgi:hypothetical protein
MIVVVIGLADVHTFALAALEVSLNIRIPHADPGLRTAESLAFRIPWQVSRTIQPAGEYRTLCNRPPADSLS